MAELSGSDLVLLTGLALNFVAIMSFPIRLENRITKLETTLELLLKYIMSEKSHRNFEDELG